MTRKEAQACLTDAGYSPAEARLARLGILVEENSWQRNLLNNLPTAIFCMFVLAFCLASFVIHAIIYFGG